MKILNYGSLNIDVVYSVEHIVRGGETIDSSSMMTSAGGKGANQSAALGKAGCTVFHAGKIGSDGLFLKEMLDSYDVDTRFITVTDQATGKAIIQLDSCSQNAIILHAGENKRILQEEIDHVIEFFSVDDWLILQNEINEIGYLMGKAKARGMKICFNPAPYDESVLDLPLDLVDFLIVNEIEGAGLVGCPVGESYTMVLDELVRMYPEQEIILTAGKHGSYYGCKDSRYYQPIIDSPVIDTTAAGDTFIGYFFASRTRGYGIAQCLYYATLASSFAVSKLGAMRSIPYWEEVFTS